MLVIPKSLECEEERQNKRGSCWCGHTPRRCGSVGGSLDKWDENNYRLNLFILSWKRAEQNHQRQPPILCYPRPFCAPVMTLCCSPFICRTSIMYANGHPENEEIPERALEQKKKLLNLTLRLEERVPSTGSVVVCKWRKGFFFFFCYDIKGVEMKKVTVICPCRKWSSPTAQQTMRIYFLR